MILFEDPIPKLSLKERALFFHFKTFTGWLLIATLTAITWTFLYEFKFIEMEGIWEWSYAFGKVFNGIILSLIASAIFYFVFSYIPEKRKRIRIKGKIEYYIFQFYKLGESITRQLANVDSIVEVPMQEWEEKCDFEPNKNMPRYSIMNPHGPAISWFDYMDKIVEHEDYYISFLSNLWIYLPIEVIDDIKKIQDPGGFRNQLATFRCLYCSKAKKEDGSLIYTSLAQFSDALRNHIVDLQKILRDYQIALIG